MMSLDVVTVVVCVALIVLAVVSSLVCNVFRRLPSSTGNILLQEDCPPLSIVISVHDNAMELERNLPVVLSQDYPLGFEVIVVDESSTDDTADVLKRLKNKYPNLYVTFIPESSHYLSRRKLSLTLGVKAAKNEWIVFTSADCRPATEQWLSSIGRHCSSTVDMVLGYTGYSDESKTFHRFYRMLTSCYCMRKAACGKAYAHDGHNLVVRKETFFAHEGFLSNLKYLRGEYDFMVNEYASDGNVSVAIEQEAKMMQDVPSGKSWLNDHLYYMETRKHLARSFAYRIQNNLDMAMLHLNCIVQAAALAYSIACQQWPIAITAFFCIVLTLTLRIMLAAKVIARFGESIPLWLVPWMELWVLWQRLSFRLRYILSDKNDFIRR